MKQPVMNTNIIPEAYLRGNKKSAVDYIGSLVTFFFFLNFFAMISKLAAEEESAESLEPYIVCYGID